MTAPTAGAFTTFPLGPGQATDNITGLGNNQARGMGIIGATATDAKDVKVGGIKVTTGTVPGSPNGTGSCSIYLAISEDGTNFTDFLVPTSTDGVAEGNKFVTSQSLGNMLVQKLFTPASATSYIFNSFSLLQKLGYVPTFFSVYVVNNTGAALSTTAANFIAGSKTITYN